MKNSLILFVLSFLFVPVSFSASQSDFELDCWHAVNNSSITVDATINDGNSYITIVRLAPGDSQIFDSIPQGYNPRIQMISAPWDIWWYPMDCQDGNRDPDPQWYTDYKNAGTGTGTGTGTTPSPVPITGYFTSPVSVASGSYNWTMTLNLSQSGHIDSIQDIQLWNAFHIDSATPSGNTIVLALSPNTAPLAVACGTYTVTVPGSLVLGNDTVSTNPDSIVGSFSVTDCPTPPVDNTGSTNTGSTGSGFVPPTASGSYMAITYKDPVSGATYVDLYALFYLLVYASGVSALFYGLFRLFKKAFTRH